ncbi:hypothetical protein, partial [Acinetobacter guillouiae]|uniref:hypothetical protein n=1 Tax=Acinetobacter guillouiae TaxID=106649 RepID=UPI00148EFC49
ALLCDLGLLQIIFSDLNASKDLKSFDGLIKTLVPNNAIYMNILTFYTICHMALLFILGLCVYLKKKIFPRVLGVCEFFSPVAEVLFQLLSAIAGVFLASALLMMLSTKFYASFIYVVIASFIFLLSIAALTINRVITHNYKNL